MTFPVRDEEEPNENDDDGMNIDVHHEKVKDEVSNHGKLFIIICDVLRFSGRDDATRSAG